jgi:hypothetical protein
MNILVPWWLVYREVLCWGMLWFRWECGCPLWLHRGVWIFFVGETFRWFGGAVQLRWLAVGGGEVEGFKSLADGRTEGGIEVLAD